jgi:hypothetical protein
MHKALSDFAFALAFAPEDRMDHITYPVSINQRRDSGHEISWTAQE